MALPPSPSSLDALGADIAEAARTDPAIARAMREENAALSVAAAVAELLEFRDVSAEQLASRADLPLDELESILAGETEGATSVVTLAAIAAALGYRFGFNFVPRELPADPFPDRLQWQLPDQREV